MSTLKKLQTKLNKLESEKMSETSSDRADLGIHSRSTSSKTTTSTATDQNAVPTANPNHIYTAYPVRLQQQADMSSVASLATNATGQNAQSSAASNRAHHENDNSEVNSSFNYVRMIDEAEGSSKLVNTEKRVGELEKQLEQMKRLLNEDKVEHRQLQQQRELNVSRFNRYAEQLNVVRQKATTSFESDTTLFDVESSVFEDNYLPAKRKVNTKYTDLTSLFFVFFFF